MKKRHVRKVVTSVQEEMEIALLRHAAIGERLAEEMHGRLVETRTAEEFWALVQVLSVTLGLPGVCLILDGRLYEMGDRGGEEKVIGVRVPRGRLLLRLEGEKRRASMAVGWMVRQALEEGGGRDR